MSAIWGHIEFNKETCTLDTMSSEYKRKCKLDKITERTIGNALFGSGLQLINAEDEYEKMPYSLDDDKYVITADSILDNRDELISMLCPESAKNSDSIPDGQLICLAFKKWHYEFPKHLKGLFSVAVYNVADKELFLCTDQVAGRCLYYYTTDNSCTFSTLISPIRKVHPDLKQNESYIIDFLALPGLNPNYSSNETPWENVLLLEAGCSVTLSFQEAGQKLVVKNDRYYDLRKIPMPHSMKELKAKFLETYSNAAKAVVRTNGEVSVSLSSGFDSTSVAALASIELAKSGKKLHSYTYVPYYKVNQKDLPSSFVVDETEAVKTFAQMYPNIDTHFENDGGESFISHLDELCDIMEIPFKAFVNLPIILDIYRKSKASGSKVVLVGQYGNASVSFGTIYAALFHLYLNKRYINFIRYFSKYCKQVKASRKDNLPKALHFMKESKKALSMHIPPNKTLLNPYLKEEYYNKASFIVNPTNSKGLSGSFAPMTEAEHTDYLYSLPAFAYIGSMETKLGLYSGIVLRDATRNIDLLEYCYSIPYEYFSYNGLPRYLIRGFMKEYIPESILYPIDRYGLQSGDWLERIEKSPEDAYKILEQLTTNVNISKYIKVQDLKSFLSDKPKFNNDNDFAYKNIFFLLSLERYLDSIKQFK